MIWLCLGVFLILLLTYRNALSNNPSKLELFLVPVLGFMFAFTMGQNIFFQTQLGLDLFSFSQLWRIEAVLVLFWGILLIAWLFRAGATHTKGRLVLILSLLTLSSAIYSGYLGGIWADEKGQSGNLLFEASIAAAALLIFIVMLLRMRRQGGQKIKDKKVPLEKNEVKI